MATDEYRVMLLGKEEGPYAFTDLQQMVRARQIEGSTQIRKTDGTWFAAGTMPGLYSDKEWITALLLALFLGALGVDRFYLGYGGLGVWSLIDIVQIATNRLPDAQGRILRR